MSDSEIIATQIAEFTKQMNEAVNKIQQHQREVIFWQDHVLKYDVLIKQLSLKLVIPQHGGLTCQKVPKTFA